MLYSSVGGLCLEHIRARGRILSRSLGPILVLLVFAIGDSAFRARDRKRAAIQDLDLELVVIFDEIAYAGALTDRGEEFFNSLVQ